METKTTKEPKVRTLTPEGRAKIAAASKARMAATQRQGGKFAKKDTTPAPAPINAPETPTPASEAHIPAPPHIPTARPEHQALLPLPGDTEAVRSLPSDATPAPTPPATKKSKPAPPAGAGARASMQSLGIGQTDNERHREALSLVAQHARTIEQLRTERSGLREELAEAKTEMKRSGQDLSKATQELSKASETTGQLKAANLAFRAAAWSAIETLTSGACKMPQDDPRFLTTSPTEMCGLLIEAVQHGRDGIEMAAVVGELLGIEGDPKRWQAQIEQALADRIEAAEGPLRAERDQWKAEAERYQLSTNNLGGMLKAQGRDDEYHGPGADLPGGLLSGLPQPFRWLAGINKLTLWLLLMASGVLGIGVAELAKWIGGAK